VNLGRALELVLIVLVVAYFASRAHVVAMRWHSRQHTQTLNRALAYLILTGPHNSTRVRDFVLKAGGGDVVFIGEHFGLASVYTAPGSVGYAVSLLAEDRVTYDSGWPYGFYRLKGLFLSPENYTVVEVRARA